MLGRSDTLELVEQQEISKSSIDNQQGKILLKAIDDYLFWRRTGISRDRYYPVTIFTWLRHYTAF